MLNKYGRSLVCHIQVKMMCSNGRVVEIQHAGVCQSHNVDGQVTVRTASDCKSQLVSSAKVEVETATPRSDAVMITER